MTLAKAHMRSVSACPEATREARMFGVKILSNAFTMGGSLNSTLRGLVTAGREVAGIYETGGMGMSVSLEESVRWMGRCAGMGDVESMCDYALCLEMGHGVKEPDLKKAFDWYLRAAAAEGDGEDEEEFLEARGEARFSVGEYYETGKGGNPVDHSRAVMWYKRGADDGDEDCEVGLRRLADIAKIVKGIKGMNVDGVDGVDGVELVN